MLKEFVSKVLGKEVPAETAPERKPEASTSQKHSPKAPARPVSTPSTNPPANKESNTLEARLKPVASARMKEATQEEVEKIMASAGSVLSAPGGVVELTSSQAKYVALMGAGENGRNILVVSKDFVFHHEASAARSLFRRKGLAWNKEFLVDLDVIRRIYEKAAVTAGSGSRSETAQMQKDFIGLLHKAASVKASDIHVIVHRYEAVIRIRADGVMTKLQELPSGMALELCQAAFAMADASDPTYMPMEYQGARVTETSLKGLRFPDGVQSVRLQFNPLPAGGRYMIARLLYSQKVGSTADVDELGYAPNQIRQIRDMRRKPYGINIISGPTGSGKSTTLQRGLTALMREKPGINVVTIEDPPEYIIDGAAQLPVTNAKTADERSEKFRQAITAALRSDPDVIMIGEIRDSASSHLAFEAAMTGHGVWASLHANDAVSILDRLRDQGVEMFKLCDGTLMTGLIGQRLVRKTNPKHAVSFEDGVQAGYVDKETAEDIKRLAGERIRNIRFARTEGLEDLAVAYQGRSVVAETILPDQKFLDLFGAGKKPEAVAYWLSNLEGMTMLEHAFVLMCSGHLDPRELEDKVGLIRDIDPDRIETVFKIVKGQKK